MEKIIYLLIFLLFVPSVGAIDYLDYYKELTAEGFDSSKIQSVHELSGECFNVLSFLYSKLYNNSLPISSYEEFLNKSELMYTRTHMLQMPSEAMKSEYVIGYRRVYFLGKPFEDIVLDLYTKPATEQMITYSYNFKYGLDACFFATIEETNFTSQEFYEFQKNRTLKIQYGIKEYQSEPTQVIFVPKSFLVTKGSSDYFASKSSFLEFNNNMTKIHRRNYIYVHPLSVKEVYINYLEKIVIPRHTFPNVTHYNLNDNTISFFDISEKYEKEQRDKFLIGSIYYVILFVLIILALTFFLKKRK